MNEDEIPIADREAWPEPIIPFSMPTVLPPFPVDALPDVLRNMVEEVSTVLEISPEIPAALSLSVAATAAAGGFEVRVGQSHDEVLALWTLSILESGERKTAAFDRMIEPVLTWEKDILATFKPAHALVIEQRETLAAELREVRRRLSKTSDPVKRTQLQSRHDEIVREMPELPPSPELLVQDTTAEALAQKMARQFGRAGLLSDEGGIFGNILGRYEQGAPNVDIYLKGHSGSLHKVDRTGRPPDVIRRPVLCLGLAIQPAAVALLHGNDHLRGVGLLARFLPCRGQERAGLRPYVERPVDREVAAVYGGQIRRALEASLVHAQAGKPAILKIEGPALDAWKAAYNKLESQLRDGGRLAGFRDWGSKAPGAVARIAGAFHVLCHGDRSASVPIAAEDVERGLAIVDRLADHAIAILGSLGASVSENDALAVLRWATRHNFQQFPEAKLHEHLRTFSPERKAAALGVLADRRFIRRRPAPEVRGPGRRPTPVWEVNPAVFGEGIPPSNNSSNSDNGPGDGSSLNSLNCSNGGLAEPPTTEGDGAKPDGGEGSDADRRAQMLDDAAIRMEIEGGPCPADCPVHGPREAA